MRRLLLWVLLLCSATAALDAQSLGNLPSIPTGNDLPSVCYSGQYFARARQGVYFCTTTNTWTLIPSIQVGTVFPSSCNIGTILVRTDMSSNNVYSCKGNGVWDVRSVGSIGGGTTTTTTGSSTLPPAITTTTGTSTTSTSSSSISSIRVPFTLGLLAGDNAGGIMAADVSRVTNLFNGIGHYLRDDGTKADPTSTDASQLLSGTLSAGRLPAFTGDVTTSAGTSNTTLATVNNSPGTYGDASNVPIVTVTQKGQVTGITTTPVVVPAVPGLTPGTYGSSAQVPVITVNSGGQVTSVSTQNASTQNDASGLTTGTLPAARMPALTGDITSTVGTVGTTLATVNSNTGSFGSTTAVPVVTVNGKGQVTAMSTTGLDTSALTTGTLAAARMPAHTGDVTTTAGSVATTLATVNSNTGSFGSTTAVPVVTVNGKGLVTAMSTTGLDTSALTSGTLAAARHPALTGDVTTSAGSLTTTLATVNGNTGSFGSSIVIPVPTVNGKGLITGMSTATNYGYAWEGTLTGSASCSTGSVQIATLSIPANTMTTGSQIIIDGMAWTIGRVNTIQAGAWYSLKVGSNSAAFPNQYNGNALIPESNSGIMMREVILMTSGTAVAAFGTTSKGVNSNPSNTLGMATTASGDGNLFGTAPAIDVTTSTTVSLYANSLNCGTDTGTMNSFFKVAVIR